MGKAIPLHIQRQLDANIETLGRQRCSGPLRVLTEDERHVMLRAAYTVLRDTGRRTGEVASLKLTCLSRDADGAVLIYDNHKAGRLGRRLPINQGTADVLEEWITLHSKISVPAFSNGYLFLGASQSQPHMRSSDVARYLKAWVTSIERLDTDQADNTVNLFLSIAH